MRRRRRCCSLAVNRFIRDTRKRPLGPLWSRLQDTFVQSVDLQASFRRALGDELQDFGYVLWIKGVGESWTLGQLTGCAHVYTLA